MSKKIIEEQIYTLKETAELLSVSVQTLRNWDNSGFFKAGRTEGKHRRYSGKQIKRQIKKMVGENI